MTQICGFGVISVRARNAGEVFHTTVGVSALQNQSHAFFYKPVTLGIENVASSNRYEVLRPLGFGGMGVGYEAYDFERGQKVALKTIFYPGAERIDGLKREFRVLANLSHPNLVALYDLVVDADSCFFTTELLDGVDLLTHLWDRKIADPQATPCFSGGLVEIQFAAGSRSTPPLIKPGAPAGIVIHHGEDGGGPRSGHAQRRRCSCRRCSSRRRSRRAGPEASSMHRVPEGLPGGSVRSRHAARVQQGVPSCARSKAGARSTPP